MTTDITELTQEAARESGSILIIVAARMARREFFTPLHALCESGKRVVSTRALCDAVERAEERMVSQVPKIVDGHDRLTKKLKEAESRNAELVEALEKAQVINAAAEKLVRCKGRYHSEKNYRALASLFGVTTPDLPPLEHENVHYADAAEMEIAALRQRIAELESRTVTVKLPDDEDGQVYGFGKWSNRKLPATAGTMTIAYCEDAWRAAFEVFSSAAGIKWEAE
ncbi:ead/Ea22-like family protein [Klebsiella grimontii]|uniref:ead/Ea22-like family protein n=1 Tax=Klebsiella grimontii TaxID=2058152 RepID=UPI002930CC66|nr:ead/Ea22-like family protein [Klebsiella grimontii]